MKHILHQWKQVYGSTKIETVSETPFAVLRVRMVTFRCAICGKEERQTAQFKDPFVGWRDDYREWILKEGLADEMKLMP
jgi:hypothetical protein